jgi:hypothetical protein
MLTTRACLGSCRRVDADRICFVLEVEGRARTRTSDLERNEASAEESREEYQASGMLREMESDWSKRYVEA